MLNLKNIMRANATSCLVFGLVFALLPDKVALFLGGTSPAPDSSILIIGVLLIVNGFHLFWASTAPSPNKKIVLYFSFGDFIWVIASVVLLITGLWISTSSGILATIAVAIMVGTFGYLQIRYVKNMQN